MHRKALVCRKELGNEYMNIIRFEAMSGNQLFGVAFSIQSESLIVI